MARVCPVVITGPAGIGKSAVAETFLAGLDDSWSVVELFCDPRRSVTPLHPFRPVLPELFTTAAEPSARAVVAALRERWGQANPVLLVDDVDSADPSTRQLLDELPDQLASGLVVLTSRSPAPIELDEEVVAAHRPRPARPGGVAPGGRRHRRRAPPPPGRAQRDRRPVGRCAVVRRGPDPRRAGCPERRGARAGVALRLADGGARSPRTGPRSGPAVVGPRTVLRRGGRRVRHRRRRAARRARPAGRDGRCRCAPRRRRPLPLHQRAGRRGGLRVAAQRRSAGAARRHRRRA